MEGVSRIDQMSDFEFASEAIKFFGSARFIDMLGWSFLGALLNWDSPAELARQLEDRGLTEHSLYRTLRDLRRFGEYLESRPLPPRDNSVPVLLLRRLGSMRGFELAPTQV